MLEKRRIMRNKPLKVKSHLKNSTLPRVKMKILERNQKMKLKLKQKRQKKKNLKLLRKIQKKSQKLKKPLQILKLKIQKKTATCGTFAIH